MIQKQVLGQFFDRYGTLVRNEETGVQENGILSPVRRQHADAKKLRFEQVGFFPKEEYLLLLPEGSELVKQHARLQIGGVRYHVLDTQVCELGGEIFYERVYLARIADR